jgi:hypothetical protein
MSDCLWGWGLQCWGGMKQSRYGYGDDDPHAEMGYAWAMGVYCLLPTLCGSFGADSRAARRDFFY